MVLVDSQAVLRISIDDRRGEDIAMDDALKAAKVELVSAQARKAIAEAEKAEAGARAARANAEGTEHNLMIGRREWAELMASDPYNNVYRFTGTVEDKTVEQAIRILSIWSRTKPGESIRLVFQSPGGSVVPGLALFDFLGELREQGHHLTTVTRGYAASMAGILLQAGDVRVIGKESWILIHEISASAMGSFGELSDRMDWLEKVQGRILDIFAERAKTAMGTDKPITRSALKKNWTRKDWWISSDEALKLGIVDEIR